MAHEIHKRDRFGHVGEPGWHGIGRPLPEGIDAQQAFQRMGIGWKTELLPLFGKSNEQSSTGGHILIPCPDHRVHVRSDTRQILGVVSKGYQPFENQDLAKFADALAGEDAAVTVETAGTLYDCRRVFALVKLPYSVHAAADDRLDLYVLVANGHGGVACFSVWPTSIRVVCANTFRMSERDAGKGLRFRHTGDFDEKVRMARKVLGTAQREAKLFEEKVKALVGANLSIEGAKMFMERAWEISFGKLDNLEGESLIKMTAKRDVEVADWLDRMDNERNNLPGISGTLWSAFNAVTEWHDHERGRSLPVKQSQVRLHSNLFGVSSVAKMKTFRHALTLV